MKLPDLLRSRLFLYGAVIALFVVAGGGLVWQMMPGGAGSRASGQALVGGPFALTDQHGERVTEQDFAGRFMLIYFGYTYCPDVCPLSLSTMARALDLLAPEEAERVVPIFITVDPERDTVEQLAEYVPLFHPRLIGLTGTVDEIKQVAKAYRVYFAKVEDEGASDYLMDHSGFIYLMGPDGAYLRHFSHTASAEEIAEALHAALAAS